MTDTQPKRSTPPATPRWVKIMGIVILVAILLFVIVGLFSGIQHGPKLHNPAGGMVERSLASSGSSIGGLELSIQFAKPTTHPG
jgi:hypothetical protein